MPRARSCRVAPWAPRRRTRTSTGSSRQVADRADPLLGEDHAGLLADTPQAPDREWREERGLVARRHDDEPVGLAQVRGDLGHQLGGGDARRWP